MLIIENAIKSIREESSRKSKLKEGAMALLSDYKTDKELTAFTSLDGIKYGSGEA